MQNLFDQKQNKIRPFYVLLANVVQSCPLVLLEQGTEVSGKIHCECQKSVKMQQYNTDFYIAFHILPYTSFFSNDVFLLPMFTVTLQKLLIFTCTFKSLVTPVSFVSYKKLCILQKETSFVSTVFNELLWTIIKLYTQYGGSLFQIFRYQR